MQRLYWIDAMKGIAMILVIYCHCENTSLWMSCFFEPIFLTGFFFASGYLFHNPEKDFCIKRKFVRLIESLVIPYLLYWAITFFVDKLSHGTALYDTVMQFGNALLMGNKLWFVSCLIVTELFMMLALKFSKNPIYIMGLAIVMATIYKLTPLSTIPPLPWYANNAFMAFLYMAAGYWFRSRESVVLNIVNRGGYFVLLYLATVTLNWWCFDWRYSFPGNQFPHFGYYLYASGIGLIGFYWVCNHMKESRALSYIGTYSLLFYFFQHQVQLLLERIYHGYCTFIPYFAWSYVEALLTVILLFIPVSLVVKYFPLLAGKTTFISQRVLKGKS